MTNETLISMAGGGILWIASIEYRLGHLLGMKEDIKETKEAVAKIYDYLIGTHYSEPRSTEEGLRTRRR
jgi:hypothetical protein